MIEIKYNCPEKLDLDSSSGCGVYCEACKKNVFDFRGKSYGEIMEITDNENIQCGIFDSSIAKETSSNRVRNIFRMAFAAVFLFGFNANILFGQTEVHYPADIDSTEEVQEEYALIKGVIYDNKDRPIKGEISYSHEGEYFSCQTDENGYYEMVIPKAYASEGAYFYLSFTAEKMESKYVNITLGEGAVFTVDAHLNKYKAPRHRRSLVYGYY